MEEIFAAFWHIFVVAFRNSLLKKITKPLFNIYGRASFFLRLHLLLSLCSLLTLPFGILFFLVIILKLYMVYFILHSSFEYFYDYKVEENFQNFFVFPSNNEVLRRSLFCFFFLLHCAFLAVQYSLNRIVYFERWSNHIFNLFQKMYGSKKYAPLGGSHLLFFLVQLMF